jgi:hypothetical protein
MMNMNKINQGQNIDRPTDTERANTEANKNKPNIENPQFAGKPRETNPRTPSEDAEHEKRATEGAREDKDESNPDE